jgi:hypothetical protein
VPRSAPDFLTGDFFLRVAFFLAMRASLSPAVCAFLFRPCRGHGLSDRAGSAL